MFHICIQKFIFLDTTHFFHVKTLENAISIATYFTTTSWNNVWSKTRNWWILRTIFIFIAFSISFLSLPDFLNFQRLSNRKSAITDATHYLLFFFVSIFNISKMYTKKSEVYISIRRKECIYIFIIYRLV